MAEHWTNLIKGILSADETKAIHSIQIVTQEELDGIDQYLTNTEFKCNLVCLHQILEDRVSKTPDRIAMIFEDQRVTYRELNERANVVAHKLISLGVVSNAIVGLGADRSVEQVVAILGIHKAGGAYMGLDPDFPEHRINYVIEDSQCDIIVTRYNYLTDE